jgi:hypothetical protein
MKKLLVIYILLQPFTKVSFAQSDELLVRISLAQKLARLEYEEKYDSIITLTLNLPFRDSVYLYPTEGYTAQALLEKGDTTNAMVYLSKAVEYCCYNSPGNLKYVYGKYKLESNSQYQSMLANFDKLYNKYGCRLNNNIIRQCLEIRYTDTRFRNVWLTVRKDSIVGALADKLTYISDTMNITAMKQLLTKYGHYPGISDISSDLLIEMTYIVAHWASSFDRDILTNYLIAATRSGQIPNWIGPYILDKIEDYDGKPLLYGVAGTANNYKDGVFYFPDVQDIDHVDKRRAVFLLPPLYKEQEKQKCVLPKSYNPNKQKV